MIVFEQSSKRTLLYWPAALASGLIATWCIVWLMTQLITPQEVNTKLFKLLSIDFIQINHTPVIEQADLVDVPSTPTNLPTMLEQSEISVQLEPSLLETMQPVPIAQPILAINISMPDIAITELSSLTPTQNIEPSFDEDLYPILTNEPNYPSRAKRARIEGWVNVAFTITLDGKVVDIEVIAAQPEGVFENSTLNALKGWRFKPQILAGKPQERRVVQTIQFELSK